MSKHLSDKDIAYACAQWASGITQKTIARQFGLRTPDTICSAIERFILKYTNAEVVPSSGYAAGHLVAQDHARRKLAKRALQMFLSAGAQE